ncbi:hypothetical protein CR513_32978, partial [Mucuna pruriens]
MTLTKLLINDIISFIKFLPYDFEANIIDDGVYYKFGGKVLKKKSYISIILNRFSIKKTQRIHLLIKKKDLVEWRNYYLEVC